MCVEKRERARERKEKKEENTCYRNTLYKIIVILISLEWVKKERNGKERKRMKAKKSIGWMCNVL